MSGSNQSAGFKAVKQRNRWQDGTYALITLAVFAGLGVLALATYMGASKGYQSAYQNQRADSQRERAAYKASIECRNAETPTAAIECYQREYKITRDENRSDEDLNAQREMADWTEGVLWATLLFGALTVALTLLGVWWVKQTFDATVDTANAAYRANEIAAASATHQRRQATLAGRPYVLIEPGEHNFFEWRTQRVNFKWPFHLANYGGSPAMIVSAQGLMVLSDAPPPFREVSDGPLFKPSKESPLFGSPIYEGYKFRTRASLESIRDVPGPIVGGAKSPKLEIFFGLPLANIAPDVTGAMQKEKSELRTLLVGPNVINVYMLIEIVYEDVRSDNTF